MHRPPHANIRRQNKRLSISFDVITFPEICQLICAVDVQITLVLTRLYPGLRGETNCNHIATPALANLAENADFFIFSSNGSKHQAFYIASDCRKEIIYFSVRGESNRVTALVR
ncbi:hypothetical protein [Pectobacterium parmentieri]|uniref:hypothetical protein n=1 Tax=Pectobacterium parmentieri TaxID=1905730 RepID=UPI0018E06270|nr:hypothetical protein [Pectobacterium parmentieri]MBI0550068.1 hypothetical protein [Pectobacterium parmentieri]MBI0559117.1 hypothetical protein [Pectobacterium parmentieri]MBI0563135.1 hypothetical protein [Pectobacterium parmentieri]